jgi:hypothetical protein
MKINRTIHAALRHHFDNCGAESASLRRRDARPVGLGPAHGEGVTNGPPADIYATPIP